MLRLGATIGNGLAGASICPNKTSAGDHTLWPLVVVDHTLAAGETHGVMHHFWATGSPQVDRMWVEYFIDGEASPSISYQPSMACGVGFPATAGHDFEYSASGLCGKTAPLGGWYNTFPIPFYKSVLVTVRANEADSCFGGYVNVRGTPNLPLVLPVSGVPLPAGTRMALQKNPIALRQPNEDVSVASFPAGTSGVVFQVAWAVQAAPVGGASAGGGYIEGCWRLHRQANEPFPGLIIGTGVEDYFDSGFYFGADSGDKLGTLFSNALSGLTQFERTDNNTIERLSAYRFHTADPLVFTDGGK